MKEPLLVTGSSGLIASQFINDFSDKYSVEPVDISNPVNPIDITKAIAVNEAFENSEAKHVLHFAAFTDVSKAWEQRDDQAGLAYQVNVIGTENIVRAAASTGKHLVHISTAYVFDGSKDEMYTEEDITKPIEWYGYTKAKAEEKVTESTAPWTILRIDQPFRSDPFERQDIAHRILDGLKHDSLYPQFTDHYFGPTYINDFSKVLDEVISSQVEGLYHATSGEMWTDYDFASEIKKIFEFDANIEKGSLDDYLKTYSRPYQRNTALDSTKLKSTLSMRFKTIAEALAELKY